MVIPSQALTEKNVREGVETTLESEDKEPVLKAPDSSVSYKRSLIIGMLLGNSFSHNKKAKNGKLKKTFVVAHPLKEIDLIKWKAEKIKRCFKEDGKIRKYRNQAFFSIIQKKRIRVIVKWFYRDKDKIITDKIRFMDHPIGVAMLLSDNGSVKKRKKKHKDGTVYYSAPSITIATEYFSDDDIFSLIAHIRKLCGAEGYIGSGNVKQVRFNAENSKLLWYYVRQWIPVVPSMANKFAFIIERYGINSDEKAGT
jgi:hypothetical protein